MAACVRNVCVTGATASVFHTIRTEVDKLGGRVVDSVEDSDTVLVCLQVGSLKHQSAVSLGAPVVTLQWVLQSREEGALLPPSGFQPGPLHGLRICVTGFADTKEARARVQKMITDCGGEYCPDMAIARTSCLVAGNTQSAKYRAAFTWKLPIVTPKWLHACVEQQRLLPFDRYRHDGAAASEAAPAQEAGDSSSAHRVQAPGAVGDVAVDEEVAQVAGEPTHAHPSSNGRGGDGRSKREFRNPALRHLRRSRTTKDASHRAEQPSSGRHRRSSKRRLPDDDTGADDDRPRLRRSRSASVALPSRQNKLRRSTTVNGSNGGQHATKRPRSKLRIDVPRQDVQSGGVVARTPVVPAPGMASSRTGTVAASARGMSQLERRRKRQRELEDGFEVEEAELADELLIPATATSLEGFMRRTRHVRPHMYLSGCWVQLVGFPRDRERRLVALLRLAGASRVVEGCDEVTHVVAHTSVPKNTLADVTVGSPAVVTVGWLLECFRALDCPSPTAYLWGDATTEASGGSGGGGVDKANGDAPSGRGSSTRFSPFVADRAPPRPSPTPHASAANLVAPTPTRARKSSSHADAAAARKGAQPAPRPGGARGKRAGSGCEPPRVLRSSGRPVFQTLAPSPDNADAACGSEELGLAMTGDIAPTAASLPDATPAGDDTVFDGLCFALIELENPRDMEKKLLRCGATVNMTLRAPPSPAQVASLMRVDYIVAQHGCESLRACKELVELGRASLEQAHDSGAGTVASDADRDDAGPTLVSKQWVARCRQMKRLMDPLSCPLFRPIAFNIPLKEFAGMKLSVTGYQGHERMYIKSCALMLGAEFNSRLNAKTTYLLCQAPEGEKFAYALRTNVEVLSAEWLYEAVRTGTVPAPLQYSLRPQRTAPLTLTPRAGSRGKGKGKGKGTGSTGLSRRTTPSSGGSRGTRAAAPAPRLPAQRVSPNPGTLSRRSHPPNPASILGGEAVDSEAVGNVAASSAGGTSRGSGGGEGEGSRSDRGGEGSELGKAAGLPLHGHKVIIDGYRMSRKEISQVVAQLGGQVVPTVDKATHIVAQAKRNSRISRVATRRNLPSLQLADLKDMKRALMSRSAAAVADSSPAVRGANADDTSQSTITLGSDVHDSVPVQASPGQQTGSLASAPPLTADMAVSPPTAAPVAASMASEHGGQEDTATAGATAELPDAPEQKPSSPPSTTADIGLALADMEREIGGRVLGRRKSRAVVKRSSSARLRPSFSHNLVSASRLAAGAADAAPEKTQPQRRSRRSTRRSKNRDSQEGDELSAKVAAMAGASLRPKQRDTFLGGKWVSASLAPDQINNESQCIQYEPSLGHGGGSLTQSGDDAPRPSSFPVTDPGAVAAGARLITSASHASTREEDGTQVPPSLSPVAEPGDEDLPGTALLSSTHQPGSTPAATAIWSPGEPNEPATHACGEGTAKTPGLDGSTARGGTEQSSSSRPVLRRSRRF